MDTASMTASLLHYIIIEILFPFRTVLFLDSSWLVPDAINIVHLGPIIL